MLPESPNRVFPAQANVFKASVLPRLLQVLTLALLMTARPVWAKEHPVPLEKNVDAAKCLECHEDKSKGKAVHSAIATGCLSCHEVRVTKDVTRVKLITTTTQALCLTCHDEKEVQPGQTMHP